MSNRFARANDKHPVDRTPTERPAGLREITHTGWKDWDGHMVDLKAYLRDHYSDMNTICPDPMKANGPAPGYTICTSRPLDKMALAACTSDPEGVDERKCLLAVYKDTLMATNKKQDKQESDKGPGYFVIRSMSEILDSQDQNTVEIAWATAEHFARHSL